MPSRILSVSYDESLLSTRHMLLQQAGYEVTSVAVFSEASERCKKGEFDLLLIGHSIPRQQKQALAKEAKLHSRAKVLSILRPSSLTLAEADYSVKSADGPEALLAAVQRALGQDESQS